MRKNYFLAFLTLCCLVLVGGLTNPLNAQSYSSNLIVGGNFEAPAVTFPLTPLVPNTELTAGIWYEESINNKVNAETTYPISGQVSVVFNPAQNQNAALYRRINVEANTTYRMTLTSRVQAVAGPSGSSTNDQHSIGANIRGGNFWNSANSNITGIFFNESSNTTKSVIFNTGANTVITVRINLNLVNNGIAVGYVDDFKLEKNFGGGFEAPAVTFPLTPLVPNTELTAGIWYEQSINNKVNAETTYPINGLVSVVFNPLQNQDASIYRRIDVDANTTYRMTLSARVQDLAGASGSSPNTNKNHSIGANIRGGNFWNSANSNITGLYFNENTNTTKSVEFNTGANTVLTVRINLNLTVNGIAVGYVDDFKLDKKVVTVTTSSSNPSMGYVSASGEISWDFNTSVVATPYAGYRFINWTENSNEVSPNSTYTFNALANRNLVANFASTTIAINSGSVDASTLVNCADCDVNVANGAMFVINGSKTLKSVTLEAGGKMTVSNPLTVQNITLKASENGSFSAKIDAASTVTGTVKYERAMLDSKWYFMSFPCDIDVANIIMEGGGVLGTDWYIQQYNGARRATVGLYGNWSQITSGTLTAKQGYIFGLKTGSDTKTLTFPLDKALVESEAVSTIPVTAHTGSKGANHDGWNLIGQPYLSKFTGSGVGVNYLTTYNGSAYVGQANTAVGTILPFEAFFVQVANSNPISFNLTSRQSMKGAVEFDTADRIQLNITNEGGTDKTHLIIDSNQSPEYQINQDLEKWVTTGTAIPQIYTRLNNINYAYNALPMTSVQDLPLVIYSKNGGLTTISADASLASGLSGLLLTDNVTSSSVDLLSSDYTYDAKLGTDDSRFVITAQRITTNNTFVETDKDAPIITILQENIVISNVEPGSSIRLYDAVGRTIYNRRALLSSVEIPVSAAGLYVVLIEDGAKTRTLKINK